MKFSLVLATVGRTAELQRFLHSLSLQEYRDFELIVVDQNADDRIVPLLAPYQERFSILHLRSEKGLSRARNLGLKRIAGDVIAFPDDDCWYPRNVLSEVANIMRQRDVIDGVTGRSIDDEGKTSQGNFARSAQIVDRDSVWRCGISYTIFLRRVVIEKVGLFDESLGVGAGTPWGSGEETDYLIRALDHGARLRYDPRLAVCHPSKSITIDSNVLARAFAYACGWGRVVNKHHYGIVFKTKTLVRPFGGAVLSLLRFNLGRAAYHWNIFLGRCKGIMSRAATT